MQHWEFKKVCLLFSVLVLRWKPELHTLKYFTAAVLKLTIKTNVLKKNVHMEIIF